MEIHIVTPDGIHKITFQVKPTDTIDEIKSRLENHEDVNIPKIEQRLYSPSSKLLDDNPLTLDECNIKHNDVLTLAPMKIHVVSPDGKQRKITLTVQRDDPIGSIKHQVKDKLDIPIEDQRLTFQNKLLTYNTATLADNNICHNDTLHLEPMIIYVRDLQGKKHMFEVNPNDDISSIKDRVKDVTGIPKENQRLGGGRQSWHCWPKEVGDGCE